MIISPRIFFHFIKTMIFRVFRGIKGQKIVEDDKKLCALLGSYIFGTTQHMIFIYDLYLSTGGFSYFSQNPNFRVQ